MYHSGSRKGEKNMERKTMQEIFQSLLSLPPENEQRREELVQLGLEPTYANAIGLAVVRKGSQGDVTAARFIRDTLGEKPDEQSDFAERDISSLDLSGYTDAQLAEMAARL